MKWIRFYLLLGVISCLLGVQAQNTPAPIKLIQFVLTPDKTDWTYKVNENASVKLMVLKYGVPIQNVSVDYELGPEMLKPEKKGNLILKNGEGTINMGTSSEPGFRQLTVQTEYEGRVYKDLVKVAYSPEKILPTVAFPDDFVQYWNKAKAEAAKVPMDAQITPMPQFSTTKVDVFLVNLQNYKNGQRLYGYLCKPKAAGKYPVLFSPPGAGVKQIQPLISYAEQGYISFNIEIHGISPLLDKETYANISNAMGEYPQRDMDSRDGYYYKAVYLGCVRSIDLLCSQPEWDGKNVIVTGGSQGGALTIVTAGLDKRVTCLAAFYPALSDMTGYLHNRAGGWPHLLNEQHQSINNTPAKINTLRYYDVVNFAKQITVPGFYSWGYNDNACPPTSVFSAVNSIKAPKEIVITPPSGHWRFDESNQKSLDWIKKQLK